ncbi:MULTISPECIES: anti-adapter protein IraM [Cronobacter]|uniref:anti-adapter protein IraM n=1 Tax=Cronobacter TaxID=413496 RepID=UPI000BEA4204|nr:MULTISPECIES: anti-adapter protein IraM [Cronobacter]NCH53480.1 anti-adapter protein IraM [Cronobacter muytjensii]PQV82284.1 anti-adapter protein IraM [Cronobacter sakazakii]HDK7323774.1 anti-adapter protein IraM [Cronobacter sakazakii]
MKWTTIDTIACPNTGIVFSSIVSFKMFKLILWYESDLIIPAGSAVEPYTNGIKINDIYHPLTIYNVTSFNANLWRSLKEKLHCLEANEDNKYCLPTFPCALKVCPYGKKRNAPTKGV